MTQPKKWPENAEWARQDALTILSDIHAKSRKAQKLIADGEGLQAIYLLGQIADKATAGKDVLKDVRSR